MLKGITYLLLLTFKVLSFSCPFTDCRGSKFYIILLFLALLWHSGRILFLRFFSCCWWVDDSCQILKKPRAKLTNSRSLFVPWFVLLIDLTTSRTFNTLIHSPWSKISSLFNIYSLIFDRPLGYIFKCWQTGVLILWGQNVELVYLEKNLKLIMDMRPIPMTCRAIITSYFATNLSVKGQRDFWATRQTQHRLEKQTHPKNVISSLYKRDTCQSTPAYLGLRKK